MKGVGKLSAGQTWCFGTNHHNRIRRHVCTDIKRHITIVLLHSSLVKDFIQSCWAARQKENGRAFCIKCIRELLSSYTTIVDNGMECIHLPAFTPCHMSFCSISITIHFEGKGRDSSFWKPFMFLPKNDDTFCYTKFTAPVYGTSWLLKIYRPIQKT